MSPQELEELKALIQKSWTRCQWQIFDSYCVLGAAGKVLHENPLWFKFKFYWTEEDRKWLHDLATLLKEKYGHKVAFHPGPSPSGAIDRDWILMWNDHLVEDQLEVMSVLDELAFLSSLDDLWEKQPQSSLVSVS
jgi:hypothetical protein